MSVRQFVIFSINEEEFGLDIENISSIERMLEIFKIPNAPGYIEGLANLRGKVYTIFNLRKRFNLPCPEFDDNTKVIITNNSASEIGIIVDEVKEIVKLDESAFEPAPKALSTLKERFLSGTAKLDDRLVLMLDLEKVLTEPDIEIVKKAKK
jgi:purine-binding chemotaxis protein CheW